MGKEEIKEHLGEDIFETMFYVIYGDCTHEKITVVENRRIDMLNREGVCKISLPDCNYFVQWRDGNRNGSEVLEITKDDYEPIQRYAPVYRLLPAKETPFSMRKYNAVKDQPWFTKMERSVNYDLYHAPHTKEYWEKKAARKGMKIVTDFVEVD